MKNKNLLLVLLIIICLAGFFGYQVYERMRTDTKAPEIHMDSQIIEVSTMDPKSALTRGITATDDVDGDVTGSLVVESVSLLNKDGTISVTYAAFDQAGNVAKAQREAKYTDYESPRFKLNGPLIYPYGATFDVLTTVGAEDALEGDIQHRVKATVMDGSSIATVGVHEVQFQVTNSLGDTTGLVLPVEVLNTGTYNAELALTEYMVYLPLGGTFSAASYLDSFTLRGEDTSLVGGLPSGYSLRTAGTVDSQTPGTYTVEYRVTYTDKHATNSELDQTYTGYSKLIVVVEG